jgi:rubrerythrin
MTCTHENSVKCLPWEHVWDCPTCGIYFEDEEPEEWHPFTADMIRPE